jgi:drug/metabolite transporter (DMT)-like permease
VWIYRAALREYTDMTLSPFVFWSANLCLDTIGHVAFKVAAKAGEQEIASSQWLTLARRPWLWVGILCFAAEFLVWLAFLALVPLSQGVLLGSFNIVVLMFVGRWLFGERLTGWRMVGMVLVTLGVGLVGLG